MKTKKLVLLAYLAALSVIFSGCNITANSNADTVKDCERTKVNLHQKGYDSEKMAKMLKDAGC